MAGTGLYVSRLSVRLPAAPRARLREASSRKSHESLLAAAMSSTFSLRISQLGHVVKEIHALGMHCRSSLPKGCP